MKEAIPNSGAVRLASSGSTLMCAHDHGGPLPWSEAIPSAVGGLRQPRRVPLGATKRRA